MHSRRPNLLPCASKDTNVLSTSLSDIFQADHWLFKMAHWSLVLWNVAALLVYTGPWLHRYINRSRHLIWHTIWPSKTLLYKPERANSHTRNSIRFPIYGVRKGSAIRVARQDVLWAPHWLIVKQIDYSPSPTIQFCRLDTALVSRENHFYTVHPDHPRSPCIFTGSIAHWLMFDPSTGLCCMGSGPMWIYHRVGERSFGSRHI